MHQIAFGILCFTFNLVVYGQNCEEFYNCGLAEKEKSNYEAAITYFSKAIKEDKTYTKAFFERGKCYYEKEKYRKAERNFDKCIKLNKQFADAHYYKGLCYLNMEYYLDAADYFSKAIYCDSLNYLYYYYKGFAISHEKRNYKNAIPELEKAVKLNPNHQVSNYYLAHCYFKIKDYA